MTLEERVAVLEGELKQLKEIVLEKKVEKDWRKTFGSAANDPGFDEMVQFGREYREKLREEYDSNVTSLSPCVRLRSWLSGF